MSVIFKPEQEEHLFAPFGPTMGYYRMPEELVEQLNSKMSDELGDYSDHLVGKVSQELAFDDEIIQIAQKGLGQFVGRYQAYSEYRNNLGGKQLDTKNNNYALQVCVRISLSNSLKTNTTLCIYILALGFRV